MLAEKRVQSRVEEQYSPIDILPYTIQIYAARRVDVVPAANKEQDGCRTYRLTSMASTGIHCQGRSNACCTMRSEAEVVCGRLARGFSAVRRGGSSPSSTMRRQLSSAASSRNA